MSRQRINTRAIIWHEGKLLAVKHKQNDGTEADYWTIPGGGLDPLESLPNGITRELIEETGIIPKVGRLLFMQQFLSQREQYDEELEFFYHIENPEAYMNIDLTVTTHGHAELARIEFIDPKQEYILPRFLSHVDIEEFIVEVRAVYFHNEL